MKKKAKITQEQLIEMESAPKTGHRLYWTTLYVFFRWSVWELPVWNTG